jgi:hypothetical protein
MKELILDLSNFQVKAQLLNHIRSLEGKFRIKIVKEHKRRSDQQNSYYHAVIVDLFGDWLRENGYDLTNDDAHEMLRDRFLREDVIAPATGEIIGSRNKSTTKLSTVEFIEYNEKCAQWMAEFCGIVVPPPDPYYKKDFSKNSRNSGTD